MAEFPRLKELPWDNAVAESFFGTLKTELIHPMIFATRAKAKTAIAEWIEVFYNRQRIHSTIGYLAPVQFEELYWLKLGQHNDALTLLSTFSRQGQ